MEKDNKQISAGAGCLIIVLVIGLLLYFLIDDSGTKQSSTPPTSAPAKVDAISQMENVFEGDYSRSEIKQKLDKALSLYGIEISEENYSRTGSMLVELRKNNGMMEVEILDCIISGYTDSEILMQEMAALCATLTEK